MKLTYGQLELTLASHLRIHPDKVPTLRSRIKQLQRLQFPPGVNVGRGSKMEYTGEHLFMLVTAFELIGFGLPALTACNLVNEHWKHFAAGYGLAAIQQRDFKTEEKKEQILAVLWMQSLHEIQFSAGYGEVLPSSLKVCDETVAARELRPYDYDKQYSRLFLSIGKLLERVLTIAKDQAGVKQANCYDDEFNAWLPIGDLSGIDFRSRYPDRSNLEIRKRLNAIYGNDPQSMTQEGEEEAKLFLLDDYSEGFPF